jgi:NAD(P)-dependent dehydrogenase (short-subunit alcohol dehydrogenase family)
MCSRCRRKPAVERSSIDLQALEPAPSGRTLEAGSWKREAKTEEDDFVKLKGKVALVTGAGRGIGRGIAEVFADQGADVAVNDIAEMSLAEAVADGIRKKGRRAVTVQADVAKRTDVEPMIDKVWKELGPIDILVNNAGIETIVPFLELTDDQWTRLVDVNLRGAWLCSQVYCRRALAEKRKGSIVNIGSIQAAKVLPGRTHYAPTKLGMEALTRNMSAEMTPQGIRVNCIHPGLIDTPMTEWVMKSPDILPLILAQISLGRAGEPQEIGNVAAFLASEEASYLTGQSIFVDGGWEGK